jgi:ABC-2 type transport system ATP-binding protein
MIRYESVSKTYRDGQVHALTEASLEIREHEIFCLIGPNGAGKTTFVRLLLGLIQPTAGKVSVPAAFRPGSPAVACVLDGDGAYPDLTVRDNLRFFGSLYGLSADVAEARGLELLGRFGLADKADALVYRLSQGQKRLVSFCRAMLTEPSLLVVDEVTANLDPGNQRRVIDFLAEINERRGTTIVFSSHDLHHVQQIGGHTVLIADGRVRADLGPDAVQGFTRYAVSGFTPNGRPPARLLAESGLLGYQNGLRSLAIVLRRSEGREDDVRALASSLKGSRLESSPATLEDLYLAYVGFGHE